MKQWFRTFISYNQNLYALVFGAFVLAGLLSFLWLMPRSGIVDYGQNDNYLQELGLVRTASDLETPQERYSVKIIENYTVEKIPISGLFQFKPSRSLIYPSVVVSAAGFLMGGTYSTVGVAVVLSLWISISVFLLIKGLYSYLERFTVPAGILLCIILLSAGYAVPLNSLDGNGMFLASLLFLAAMAVRAWNYHGEKPVRMFIAVAVACFLFVLSLESGIVLLPVAGILLFAGAKRLCGSNKRKYLAAALIATAWIGVCSWRLMSEQNLTQEANLYQAAFDGAIACAEDPVEAVEWFGMDSKLAQDAGKSYYEDPENYAVCPRDEENKQLIYDHLSYGKLFAYYLTHPGTLGRMLQSVWEKAADMNTQTMLYVGEKTTEPHAKVTSLDLWQYIRSLVYPRKFWIYLVFLFAGSAVAVWFRLQKKSGLAGLYLLGNGFWAAAMFQAFWFTGSANFYRSLYPVQILTDFLLIAPAALAVRLILEAYRVIAYPRRKNRPQLTETEAEWVALEIPGIQEKKEWLRSQAAGWKQKFREKPKRLDWVFLAAGALIMVWVLFFPRIGAHNNGDYGRMLDAMSIRYNDEDWYRPEEQVIKVIEDYVYLEPYDWLHVLPPQAELSQAYVSALMRVLYILTGLPFSTVYVTILYGAVILASLYWLIRSLRPVVRRHICWIAPAFIVMFLGSGNLVWLNSLFGEGVAFTGLMAILGCSGYILSLERGEARWSLLVLAFSILFFGTAKAQYVLTLPVLMIWWGCLFVYHRPKKSHVWKAAVYYAAGVIMSTLVIINALHVYEVNNSKSSQDTIYQSLFYGVLMIVEDPEAVLEELGLDPALAADAGKHAYLDKDEYYCAPRTEMAEKMIYSKISSLDLVTWYLKHPDKLWYMLDTAAEAASDPMPDYGLYVGDKTTETPRTVSKMNFWYEIRQSFALNQFWQYIVFYGVLIGWSIWKIFSKKTQTRTKWLYGLYLTIMFTGIIQFPMTVIGNGFADNIKQLYIFRVTYDMTLLIAVYLAVRGIAGRFKRRGKEEEAHAGQKELVQ